MHRLSRPLADLKPHYSLVVVGSGYGGAVVAARVAERWGKDSGRTVCVLERGREIRPGEYPDSLPGALKEVQIDGPSGHRFSPTGLYDFRINPDLSVFMGCGLGGTSLVNAGVTLDPYATGVFDRPGWPGRLLEEVQCGGFAAHVARARGMLEPAEYALPATLEKLWLLERVGKGIGAAFARAPVAVNFPPGSGTRRPCTGCGDCITGCNYGAKNTLLTNYLPLAAAHGAQIFTETKVTRLARAGERWRLEVELLGAGREPFGASALVITADRVVLAAGALGSTEILLRSHEQIGLSRDRLGQGFTGNGDVLAFGYDTDERINAVGFGRRSPHGLPAPGPCISGMLTVTLDTGKTALVEEGVIPGALLPLLSAGFPLVSLFSGRPEGSRRWTLGARLETLVRRGPSTTQIFLAMFADDDTGALTLRDDRVRIDWPGAGRNKDYEALETWLHHAVTHVRGTFVPSPFGLVTVHPLGGCAMADRAEHGVVNHVGQVFTGGAGSDVHPTLFVCDGAVMPTALGVNPLLTIAALAERTAPHVAS